MKWLKVLPVVSLAALCSTVALAQDPVKVDPAHYKLVFENPSVRVLRITYPLGASSKMHQHPDAIVIPLVTSKVRFATPDGKSVENELVKDTAMYTPAGTHNPTNIGTAPVSALLVEFKGAAPGKATLPASRPGMTLKPLADGPYGAAYLSTASASFAEPAGTKHDFDQVVIALGPTPLSLSIDGKPAKTRWARGDALFIGRGVAHESKNTGGKPADMVIVAIK
jgi:quercetin dioxygenase-like cupin family protein